MDALHFINFLFFCQLFPFVLFVSDAPKNVTVRAQPSLVVTVNATVTLQCDADSAPPVDSVIWWKVNGTRSQNLSSCHKLTITSVTPADTGLYGCTAANELGSVRSPSVEVDISEFQKWTLLGSIFDPSYKIALRNERIHSFLSCRSRCSQRHEDHVIIPR